MIKLYQGGMSGRQVGLRFNVTISNVAYHLTKAGVWPGGKRIKPVAERFWAKVQKAAQCWNWTGAVFPNGYGCFNIAGESIGAHRVAYELTFGKPTLAEQIHHTCENKLCVNPAHLECLTPKEHRSRHPRI